MRNSDDNDKKITTEEYNKIVKAFVDKTPLEPPPSKIVGKVEEPFCYHNFVPYQGLNHKYEFCLLCNKKRDLPPEVEHTDWSGDTDGSF